MRHGWDWSGLGFGAGPRGAFMWGGSRGRRRRWFEAGDMKYVILKLLRDKPRHGYEVMKELEERFEGYSPSPGTVYPTLQWLEDEGLVSAQEVAGKKVYGITDAGRAFLEEHRDVVEDIFDRVRDAVDQALGGAMGEVNEAAGRLMKATYRTAWRSRDDAVRRKVADALRRAATEIEGLVA